MDYEKQELLIDGMDCNGCVQRVSRALGSVPGVRVHSVSVGRAEVLAQAPCKERIERALGNEGYTLKEMHGVV